MSKAYQCDRCKSFFNMESIDDDTEVCGIEYIYVRSPRSVRKMQHLKIIEKTDLCPDCTDAFLNLFLKDAMVDGERGFYAVDWKRDKEREEARKENKAENEEDGV